MKFKFRQLLLMAVALIAIGFALLHDESPIHLSTKIRRPDIMKRTGDLGLVKLKKRVNTWMVSSMPPTEGTTELTVWLQQEALQIGKTDNNPDSTKATLASKANQLSAQDVQTLKQTIFNAAADHDQRFLAVYVLALSDTPAALQTLRDIGRAPIPASTNDRSYSDEVIIRTQALEALTKRLPMAERKQFLTELMAQTSDPLMARQAKYWLHKGS